MDSLVMPNRVGHGFVQKGLGFKSTEIELQIDLVGWNNLVMPNSVHVGHGFIQKGHEFKSG